MSPRRTRQEQQAETRRRLVASAARVFAAKGFHGASVDEIAADADCTTGALYANFDSKEQLFLHMVDRQLQAQSESLQELHALGESHAIRRAIRRRVEEMAAGLAEPGDLRSSVDEGGALGTMQMYLLTLEFLLYAVRERPDLRLAIAGRYRSFEEHIAGLLTAWLKAEGRESLVPPEELAIVQSWLIEGLGLRLLQDPTRISPARAGELYQLMITELLLQTSRG